MTATRGATSEHDYLLFLTVLFRYLRVITNLTVAPIARAAAQAGERVLEAVPAHARRALREPLRVLKKKRLFGA